MGIPIIGCPDYLALIGPRAAASGHPVSAPCFPTLLLSYIQKHDPAFTNITSLNSAENPFIGKHILVLSGGIDKVVPWAASKTFVDNLQVGSSGIKKVIVEEEAGHECTPLMVRELARFVWDYALELGSRR